MGILGDVSVRNINDIALRVETRKNRDQQNVVFEIRSYHSYSKLTSNATIV